MSDGLLRDRSETGKPGPMNNLSECCWYLQAECKCHRLNRSSLSPLVPAAWVCFVFSQHFKVKPEKIKSWNHYCERSEHKYFIIWYFLCKIEFMHSDAGAVRIQKYQVTVSVSRRSKFTLWWQEEFFFFFFAECPNSGQTLNNDGWKMERLHFFVVFAPAVLHKLIPFTTSGRSIRFYTCWPNQ